MEKNLKNRILSTAILIPVIVGIIYLGGIYFIITLGVAGVIMLREWITLTQSAKNKFLWQLIGLVYIAVPCASFAWLRGVSGFGLFLSLWLLATIWATDIGAYISGKTIGGKKLAPKISPGKTWAGAVGGTIAGIAVSSFITYEYAGIYIFPKGVLAALYLVIIAQLGDLFESWIKRKFGVKDSGQLIPGHGGLLDRLDSLLFVAPAAIPLYLIVG